MICTLETINVGGSRLTKNVSLCVAGEGFIAAGGTADSGAEPVSIIIGDTKHRNTGFLGLLVGLIETAQVGSAKHHSGEW